MRVAPATPRLIDRGGVLAALDRAVASKVTIISAPAGSGKTSLLGAWADRPGQRPAGAVRVQRDQHDAQQFWLAVLGAVRHATGAVSGGALSPATPDFNAPAMVDRVLSELADAHGGVTLVIDDLRRAALAGDRHSAHPAADKPSPAGARDPDHASRCAAAAAPAAPGWRGSRDSRGRPAFFRVPTRELLRGWPSRSPTPGRRCCTSGPRAGRGLRLAALALVGHPDPEQFVAEFSGSDRTVAEYLIAEMVERQPPDVQDLLLRTSLLDRVNGALGRPADRPAGLGTDPAGPRGRERVRRIRSTPGAPGSATTACSPICSGWSCAARCPRKYPRCTGAPPPGSASTARRPRPSGTPRRPATGRRRHGCSPTIRSAWLSTGKRQTVQALVRAFPPGADHPELALVRAMGRPGSGAPGRGGRPPGGRRDVRRGGAARTPAPPPGGDRVAEAVAGQAARSPDRPRRAGPVPGLPGDRAVRRRTSRSAATCARRRW